MNRILIYSMFFAHLLHFGVNAQNERVKLATKKDSISFAFGIEVAVGIFNQEPKFESLDKRQLVRGFQSNLSDSPATDCEVTIQQFLGPQGEDFDNAHLKEGSHCIGRLSGYYFYLQMDQLDVLSMIDLKIVNRGFKQGVFGEETKNLSINDRAELIAEFGQQMQVKFLEEIETKDRIFWEEILAKPGIEQVGETGIYFETIEKGTGGKPTIDSDINAHYILTNSVGDTLESSYASGESLKMNLGEVIDGWREGFPALEKGGKYYLYVPYEKAYKNGNAQAPQGALCFFIEFIDFGEKGAITKPKHTIRKLN